MADDSDNDNIQKAAQAELTQSIPPQQGGTRPVFTDGVKDALNLKWYPLKIGKDKKGRYAIIYSFDAAKPREHFLTAQNPETMTPEQKRVMLQVFDTIEDVANVKFYEAGKPDPDYPIAGKYKPEQAFLTFFRSDNMREAGEAQGMERRYGARGIVFKGNDLEFSKGLHELTHAIVGGSHAEKTSIAHSVMGKLLDGGLIAKFGSQDALLWQNAFGKSTKQKVNSATITAGELLQSTVLYRKAPVTLDFSGTKGGTYILDLSNTLGVQAFGVGIKAKDGQAITNSTSLAPGTQIQNVVTGGEVSTTLRVRGNKLPNVLQGGNARDILVPNGGGDILTGGEATNAGVLETNNLFRLDRDSGFGNVITDFKADKIRGIYEPVNIPRSSFDSEYKADKIQFMIPDLHHVTLQEKDNFDFNGKKATGTEVTAFGVDGKAAASIFVIGRSPDYLSDRLFKISVGKKWYDFQSDLKKEEPAPFTIIPPSKEKSSEATKTIDVNKGTPNLNSVHPSGLPVNFQPPHKDRAAPPTKPKSTSRD